MQLLNVLSKHTGAVPSLDEPANIQKGDDVNLSSSKIAKVSLFVETLSLHYHC